jgi:uncharacterized lipoprotein
MKKPIIASLSVLLGVLIVAMLSSCATSRGYNYSAHAKKSSSVKHKAHKRNAGRDLVNYRCTNKH